MYFVLDRYRFLSTPSARRATAYPAYNTRHQHNFYPRPPRGGRLGDITKIHGDKIISIHALREEGDLGRWTFLLHSSISIHALREEGDLLIPTCERADRLFLSTPSARRATRQCYYLLRWQRISIHALREEGDAIIGTFFSHF